MELKQSMLPRYISPIFSVALLAIIAPMSIAADRPNIVIILADDLGYGSLNSYGADEAHIRTPNIDSLAQSGRRYSDANTPSGSRLAPVPWISASTITSPYRRIMATRRACTSAIVRSSVCVPIARSPQERRRTAENTWESTLPNALM